MCRGRHTPPSASAVKIMAVTSLHTGTRHHANGSRHTEYTLIFFKSIHFQFQVLTLPGWWECPCQLSLEVAIVCPLTTVVRTSPHHMVPRALRPCCLQDTLGARGIFGGAGSPGAIPFRVLCPSPMSPGTQSGSREGLSDVGHFLRLGPLVILKYSGLFLCHIRRSAFSLHRIYYRFLQKIEEAIDLVLCVLLGKTPERKHRMACSGSCWAWRQGQNVGEKAYVNPV